MGQAFSEPVTEKESSSERNEKFLVASSSIQGWRISMEDAHTIMLSMPDDPDASFFAVFDGHGGSKVANYASENLHHGLCQHRLYQQGQIKDALKSSFIEFDEMMFNDEKMRDELAGSTAVVVVIKNQQIYCANIGDSRAVASFSGRVDALSIDHKPTCQDEMNRIESAGGWVQFNRVNGNLALSRAFGDFVFKRNDKRSATEQIVIAYPDVQIRQLTSDLEFIVMACDGVWDVMTNEEVVEFIRRRIFYRKDVVQICEDLITRCLAPDCQMGCGIGCDNMTVILICYLNGRTYEQFCDQITNSYMVKLYTNCSSSTNSLLINHSNANYNLKNRLKLEKLLKKKQLKQQHNIGPIPQRQQQQHLIDENQSNEHRQQQHHIERNEVDTTDLNILVDDNDDLNNTDSESDSEDDHDDSNVNSDEDYVNDEFNFKQKQEKVNLNLKNFNNTTNLKIKNLKCDTNVDTNNEIDDQQQNQSKKSPLIAVDENTG